MKNIVAIYKPKGPTSHDIIYQIRKITGIKKVGHAGTLDPLASGVLVIGIERQATKQLSSIVKKEKEYIADIKFGFTSTTDDEEGEKTAIEVEQIPAREEVEEVLQNFIGTIKQVPPIYSAIKVKGQKSYQAARKGKELKLEPREVEIKDIELQSYEWPMLKIKVTTGPGVYIRALARDIGEQLKVGGYLADLERIRVGDFNKEESLTIEEFEKLWKSR